MNLTWCLICKEFRYLYLLLPLVGWWVLVVGQGLLIGAFAHLPYQPPPLDMMSEALLTFLAWLVAILKIGLLAVIVSQLVQKDSTVGSTAFWLSRPISGRRLLATKCLFLVLTMILPALLAEVVLFLFHGVTVYDTLRSIPQVVLLQLWVVAVLMMLAAVTPSLSRLILWGVLTVAGLALLQYAFWMALYQLHAYARQSEPGTLLRYSVEWVRRTRWNSSLYDSGVIGFFLFLLILAGIVVCHQYLTRRTKRSVVLASSVFPGLLMFLCFWNWDFWSTEHLPPKAILDPEQVTARIEARSLKFHRPDYSGRNDGLILQGEMTLHPLPPSLVVLPAKISAELLSASGERLARHRSIVPDMFRGHSPSSRRFIDRRLDRGKATSLAGSLGGVKFLNPEHLGWQPATHLLAIPQGLYDRHSRDEIVYSAEMDFAVQRDEITRMRLEPGFRFDRGSDHVQILAVNPPGYHSPDRGFTIELLESTHGLTLDGWSAVRYLLVNSSRKEAILGQRSFFGLDSISSPHLWSNWFPVMEVRRPSLEFNLPADGPAVDETWLQGAELVRVETTHFGMFPKTIRIEDFVLERIPMSPESSGSVAPGNSDRRGGVGHWGVGPGTSAGGPGGPERAE